MNMVTNNDAVHLLLASKNGSIQKERPRHLKYLNEFRTQQCLLFLQQQCQFHRPYTCFHWHFPNQKRRRPFKRLDGTFNYNPDVYCDKYDETTGTCVDGDDCPYAHRNAGDTERRYHPRYFKTGSCIYETTDNGACVKNGLHCAFAHGSDDIRLPLYDIREVQDASSRFTVNLPACLEKERVLSEDPKWNEMFHVLACYKTDLCKKPPRMCRQGYSCPFYHNGKDKRRAPNRWRYRSTPCPLVRPGDEWQDSATCEAGDSCVYCHTRTEQQFHPEIYKSTKCNDVVNSGYCPRGPFCAFAHCDSEMTIGRDFLTKLQQQQQQIFSLLAKSSSSDPLASHHLLNAGSLSIGLGSGEPVARLLGSLPTVTAVDAVSGVGGAVGGCFLPSATHQTQQQSIQKQHYAITRNPGQLLTTDSRKSSTATLGNSVIAATSPISSSNPLMMLSGTSTQRAGRRVGRCTSPQQGMPSWQQNPSFNNLPYQQQLALISGGPTSPASTCGAAVGSSPTLVSPRSITATASGSAINHQPQQLLQLPFYTGAPPPSIHRLQNTNALSKLGSSRDLKSAANIGRHRSGNSLSYSDTPAGLVTVGGSSATTSASGNRHLFHHQHQQPTLDHFVSPQSSSMAFAVGDRRFAGDITNFSGTATYPGGKIGPGALTVAQGTATKSNMFRTHLSPTEDNVGTKQQLTQFGRSTSRKLTPPTLSQRPTANVSHPSLASGLNMGVNPLAVCGHQLTTIDLNSLSGGASGVGHQLSGLYSTNAVTVVSPATASLWSATNSPDALNSLTTASEGSVRPPPLLYSTPLSSSLATAWQWQSPHSPVFLPNTAFNNSSGVAVGLSGPPDSGHNSETSATEFDTHTGGAAATGGGGGVLFNASFLDEHKRDSGLVLDFSLPTSLSSADAGVGFPVDVNNLMLSVTNASDTNIQQPNSHLSTVGVTSVVTTASVRSNDGVTAFRQLFPYDHLSRRFDHNIASAVELPREPGESYVIQSPSSSIETGSIVSFPMSIPGSCESEPACFFCSRFAETASISGPTLVTCSPLSSSSCCSSSSSILQQHHPSRHVGSGCILSTPHSTTSWPSVGGGSFALSVTDSIMTASMAADSSVLPAPVSHQVYSTAVASSSLNRRQAPTSIIEFVSGVAGEDERSDLMAAVSGVCPLATTETPIVGKTLASRSPSPVAKMVPLHVNTADSPDGRHNVSKDFNAVETIEDCGNTIIGNDGQTRRTTTNRHHRHRQSSFANLPQSPILMSSPFSNPVQDLERLVLQRQLNEVRQRLDVREGELEAIKRQRDAVTEHLRDSIDVIRQLFGSFHLPPTSSTPATMVRNEIKQTDFSKPLYVDTADPSLLSFNYVDKSGDSVDGHMAVADTAGAVVSAASSVAQQPAEGGDAANAFAVEVVTAEADACVVAGNQSGVISSDPNPTTSCRSPEYGDSLPPTGTCSYASDLSDNQLQRQQQEALAALFSNPMVAALLNNNNYSGLNDLLFGGGCGNQLSAWPPFDRDNDTKNLDNALNQPLAPTTTTLKTTAATSALDFFTPVLSNSQTHAAAVTLNLELSGDSDEANDLLSSASGVGLLNDQDEHEDDTKR